MKIDSRNRVKFRRNGWEIVVTKNGVRVYDRRSTNTAHAVSPQVRGGVITSYKTDINNARRLFI